ncbi:hypothetical protein M9Y10_018897 [Tritrichomonas musculus]|uniref:Uncharacterized protein n=1 Tax=Tritrichomonas musculus TaxID=1915356 RepID=A0ABR2HI36_9EUKA
MTAYFIDNMYNELAPIHKNLKKTIDSAISGLRKEIKEPKAKIIAKLSCISPKDTAQHLEKQIIPTIKKNYLIKLMLYCWNQPLLRKNWLCFVQLEG